MACVLRVMSKRLGKFEPTGSGLGYVKRVSGNDITLTPYPWDARQFDTVGAAHKYYARQDALQQVAIATDRDSHATPLPTRLTTLTVSS